jgi:TPR repeat protein
MISHRLLVVSLFLWSVSMTWAAPALTGTPIAEVQARAAKGDADAEMELARRYAEGDGLAKDLAKAAKWHRKAAEQGLAAAEFQMGMDYANGLGVKADSREALLWFEKAGNHGLAEAQLQAGLFLERGDGTKEWPAEAAKWYRRAAEQGLAAADFELGRCYLSGTGVTKDISEGIKWLQQAAEQGNAGGQACLGSCYLKGEGVPKDYVQAYKWFNLASAQGDGGDFSKVNLVKVEHLLTPEQVLEGQRLAREFKPANAAQPETPTPERRSSDTIKTGWVNVLAEDAVCEVYADTALVGNAPARLKLSEGTHVIEVRRAGFQDYRRELRVIEGSELTLRPVLEKK